MVVATLAVASWACASPGMPPGGPEDFSAPTLVRAVPESGTVKVTPPRVEFVFDEVVSERPRGATSLAQLVVISPSDGPPDVDWERQRLVVRPRGGWRANTAYAVTVLPGLGDLRGNYATRAFRTVFATGDAIPEGAVRGVAFDWMAGKAVPGARIEATIGADTALKYAIAADSTGRYALGSLPAATFTVRGWADLNGNGVRDPREPWDTVTVALPDSARHDLYLIAHDTIGARIADVSVVDSVSVRLAFDRGLRLDPPFDARNVRIVRTSDSTALAVRSVLPKTAHDSLAARLRAARADSIARADTTERGRQDRARADSIRLRRQRDSVAQAQLDSLRAARDTVRRLPPPVPSRPVPPTEFVITMAEPLPEDVPLRLFVSSVRAIVGPPRDGDRPFQRRRAPRDTTAARPPGNPPR